jgi:LCP family protein required for cell wall assembly
MAGDGMASPGKQPQPRPPPPPVPPGGPGRRPAPSPAQSQLMRRISATRRARLRRTLLLTCGLLSSLVLLCAGAAWGLANYANNAVGRIFAGTAGGLDGPLNVLLAGVDVRSGLTRAQQLELHVGSDVSSNSDTLMLIHISADRSRLTVVSLPRDSWVNIPGHGMNKINAAFGLGGPQLTVATVEQATGLTINDFIEVNFLGFVKVIDALGGVNICLPRAVDDPYSGLHLSAGIHYVNGVTALKYARDRHSFATSDLARITNQQRLLSSLLKEAISSGTLANPLRLSRFLSAALGAVKVDQNLNLIALADQLRGVTPAQVHFLTVPLGNTSYQAADGELAVLWDSAKAGRLFAALQADQPVSGQRISGPGPGIVAHGQPARLRPRQVTVDIYNGTLIAGLSSSTGTALARLGFRVHSGLNWPAHDITHSLIEFPPGQRAGARLVRTALPGAALSQTRGLARIRVVLGASGYSVAQPAAAATADSAEPRPAASSSCR